MIDTIKGFFRRVRGLSEGDKLSLSVEILNILDENFSKLLDDFKKLSSPEEEERFISKHFSTDDLILIAENLPIFKYIAFFYKLKKLTDIKSKEKALYTALRRSAGISLLKALYDVGITEEWFERQNFNNQKLIRETIHNIKSNFDKLKENLALFNPDNFDLNNFYRNIATEEIKNIIFNHLNKTNLAKFQKNLKNIERYFKGYWKGEFFEDLRLRKDTDYKELYDYLFSPSYQERIKLFNLNKYYLDIIKKFEEEPIFNDPRGVALKDVYIEPYYRVYEDCLKNKYGYQIDHIAYLEDRTEKKDKFLIKLDENIIDLLSRFISDKIPLKEDFYLNSPSIILILGYPGQGKTSLTKKLIYDFYTNNINTNRTVYLIELRDLEKEDLLENPLETIRNYLIENKNIEPNFEKTVLLLDGLDELLIQDNLSINDAENLLDKLSRQLRKHFKNNEDIKVLITSRYGYINLENTQKNKINNLIKKDLFILELREFDEEQQIQWIDKYKKFYTDKDLNISVKDIIKLPTEIKKLTSQPIILYMIVSLLTEGKLKSFEDLKNKNRSFIYETLFDYLVERKWVIDEIAKKRGNPNVYEQHKIFDYINKKDLRNLLRLLAFETFKSKYEYVHSTDLYNSDEFKNYLENTNIENLENLLKGLLIAFYLREVEIKNKEEKIFAIEFLHKSLYEYLTAEHIYYKMLALKDLTDEKALEVIWELFSYKKLTEEIKEYLKEIIEEKFEFNENLFNKFKTLLAQLLEKDFIVKPIKEGELNRPFYTFGNYWVVIKEIFSEKTLEKSNIGLESENLFLANLNENLKNKFIKFLKIIQIEKETFIEKMSLEYEELFNVNLVGIDLKKANLRKVNLMRANLMRADLMEADLKETYLVGTDLRGTNLKGSNLEDSLLINAQFSIDQIKQAKNWDKAIYDEETKRKLGLI